jgi:predicted O-methyltransferase YrrM
MTTKPWKGNPLAPSRFQDCQGRWVSPGKMLSLIKAAATTACWKITGHRPELPWLNYTAIWRLSKIIGPDYRVLEFGSGFSTLWFARRCGQLVSIEDDAAWHQIVAAKLIDAGLSHVDYRHRSETDYCDLADIPEKSQNLVIVDGSRRNDCARLALGKARPGGYVFLDNSDSPFETHQEARSLLLDAADPRCRWIDLDFCPCLVQVQESVLVRLPD